MLKQCCNHSKQYCNNVATLYRAKNRRCELSRVTSLLKNARSFVKFHETTPPGSIVKSSTIYKDCIPIKFEGPKIN